MSKHSIDLFGSIAQFASCDVLYMLKREDHALEVTLSCVGARDIEEPADVTIGLEKIPIETANGPEENLVVVSGTAGAAKKSKKIGDLEAMEIVLQLLLGNKATRTQWMEKMQDYGRGWSESNFDKKLGALKSQKRVTGGGAPGEYYSVSSSPEAQRARGAVVGAAEGAETETTLGQKNPHPHAP